MSANQIQRPLLIRRGTDVERVYGFGSRQQKRWVVEKRISHVHPAGQNGPCFLISAELDALIESTTTHAIKRG